MTNTISKFEHLPNELLLDIFTYCRPRDLFVSLFNLNHRLNSLIYIQSLNVDLGNALPKYLLDLYYKSVLHNAREQIHTLRLSDTYGRMRRFVNNDQQIEIDFSTRRMILNQVKYLILWDPMMNSLHQVLNHVNTLEYLQVTSIGRARQTPGYTDGLLRTLFQMNRLKRLSLALHDSILFDEDIGKTTLTLSVLSFTSSRRPRYEYLADSFNVEWMSYATSGTSSSSVAQSPSTEYHVLQSTESLFGHTRELRLSTVRRHR